MGIDAFAPYDTASTSYQPALGKMQEQEHVHHFEQMSGYLAEVKCNTVALLHEAPAKKANFYPTGISMSMCTEPNETRDHEPHDDDIS